MAKRIIKKITLIIILSPLFGAWIIALFLSEVFNELESITGDWVDKLGKAASEKLHIQK